MALVVWLPLINNLNNQGISNVTVTNHNAIVNSSGILGGSYYFDGNDYIHITLPSELTSIKNSSVCAWVKSTGSVVALGGISNDTNYTNAMITLYTSGWQFAGSGTYKYLSGGNIANSGVWHHVCCTCDDTTITTYLDGVKVTSNTLSGLGVAVTELTSSNFIEIGCDHPGGDEYLTGYVNDFRVYNHALSPKEVELLARGLVLHYPLGDQYIEDTTNIITIQTASAVNIGGWGGHSTQRTIVDATNYPIPCNTCNKLAVTYSGSGGGGSGMSLQRINCSPSTTYTYSCYLKTPDALGPLNANILYRYEYKSDNTKATEAGCWGPTSNVQTLSDGWYRIWGTFTVTANTTYFDVYNFVYPNKTCDYYIGCWQLELKNHVTPYVFGSRSENVVYDVSGCNYHGTKVGSPIYSADTPRYSNSTSFNGIDDCIQVPLNTFFPNAGSFTINLWFKKHEIGSKNYETVFGGISGFEMDTRNGGNTTLSYYVTGNNRGFTIQSPLNFDTWYMLTMVCDGTNELYYLNGEYKKQFEKKGMPTGNYFIGAWRDSVSQNFKGLISDFRVYATALSATQIAELYNTAVSISNNGALLGYEFVET